ncbi:hypothetical protein [Actinophytocola sp.]|uniref:hypothetical protein n=1 Tax=Actinophytocola sp. TaxID=1872138 RepID=UPI003D6A78EC
MSDAHDGIVIMLAIGAGKRIPTNGTDRVGPDARATGGEINRIAHAVLALPFPWSAAHSWPSSFAVQALSAAPTRER